MIVGSTKGFIRGKALSVEGHTHSQYAKRSHTHSISQITSLQNQLNEKAETSHTHTIAQISGLRAELDELYNKIESGGGGAPSLVVSQTFSFAGAAGNGYDSESIPTCSYIDILSYSGTGGQSTAITFPYRLTPGGSVRVSDICGTMSSGDWYVSLTFSSDGSTISTIKTLSHSYTSYSCTIQIQGWAV